MAGEALKDANYEARLRLSNDPEKAAERAALVGDKYDVSGYSDKEISMALQGDSFLDEDYARLTGKSVCGGDKPADPKPDKPTPAPSPTPDPEPSPIAPTPDKPDITIPVIPVGPGTGGQNQYVNQDNDITTNVTGDNNTVDNSQDNSVRQYGGTGDYASRYARGLKNQYVLNLLGK